MSGLSYIPKNDTWLSKRWKKILFLVSVIVGIMVLTWAVTQTTTRIDLERNGERITGQVRSLDQGWRIGRLNSSTITYTVNGVEYSTRQNFNSTMQIGDNVQIAYDVSNPFQVIQVGTISRGELVLYSVGILILSVTGFIAFLAQRTK